MKKSGFFAIIGIITVIAAVSAAVYYLVVKKHFCFAHCEDKECDCMPEEECDCCCETEEKPDEVEAPCECGCCSPKENPEE